MSHPAAPAIRAVSRARKFVRARESLRSRTLSTPLHPTGLIGATTTPLLTPTTTHSPYRRASSCESARETIRRLSGSQFDPRVVEVFLSIPEDVWPTIARNQRQIAALSISAFIDSAAKH